MTSDAIYATVPAGWFLLLTAVVTGSPLIDPFTPVCAELTFPEMNCVFPVAAVVAGFVSDPINDEA